MLLTDDERELIALLRRDPVARTLVYRVAVTALGAAAGLVLLAALTALALGGLT